MTILHAFILGVVEGITEFLPISSTAHLVIVSNFLGLAQTNLQKSFEIIIQLGAILAVLVLYWRSFLQFEILKRVFIGFVPTGIIGLLFYKVAKTYLLGNMGVLLAALFLGGLFLVWFERWFHKNEGPEQTVADISWQQCLAIGVFQAAAIVPGVSRSAATIVGGLLLGIRRSTIVEYSFLLAVPTMGAATVLDLAKNYQEFSQNDFMVLAIGFTVAFFVALGSIRWLLKYVRRHDFSGFGIYRMVLAAVLFFK